MIGLLLFASLPVTSVIDHSVRGAPRSPYYSAFAAQAADSGLSRNSAQSEGGVDQAAAIASYRLSGEKSLRPVRIGDDGTHVYIEWSEEQALPAVFALNAIGEEEMVDGYMRQGIFTIDRVHKTLVFRIGKQRAKADRMNR